MNRRSVLVIVGNYWQIPLVNKLREMGYRALVVNPYVDSPAFSYADGYLQEDIFQEDVIYKYCRDEKVIAVLSDANDLAVTVVADLAARLGLPGIGIKQAEIFTNKYQMRRKLLEGGFLMPSFALCRDVKEIEKFYHIHQPKIIIKPLDSSSSRGIHSFENLNRLEEDYADACKYSRSNMGILAEEYIEGTEFTVDGIKTPDKHYSLAVSEKKHFRHNENVACELFFSYENDSYDYDKLRELNDKVIEYSGLPYGLTHVEYKYYDGQFWLMEMAARGGGNWISSKIVPWMSGIDTYEYLINCSVGKISNEIFLISECYKQRCAVLKFFETDRGGVVKEIKGMEYLDDKAVVCYRFEFKIGDEIKLAQNDVSRIGFYIACTENKEELVRVMDEIKENVVIVLKEESSINEG